MTDRVRALAEKVWHFHRLEQDVPEEVWDAFDELVRTGFDTHLIQRLT